MSSIYGVSSSSTSGLQGYGGLASGLDRDSLIEDMLYGTQSKITAQEQKKQLVEWEMESIWAITDPMYEFTQKYTSFTSSDNLLSSSIYQANNITSLGDDHKDLISVSGNGDIANDIKVLGVQSLAQNAQLVTSGNSSSQTLTTSIINESLSDSFSKNMVEGGYLTFKYGSGTHTVYLSQNDENNYDYTTAEGIAHAINTELSELTTALGEPLSDSVKVTASADGTISFSNTESAGNGISISGGSDELLTALGLKSESEMWLLVSDERKAIDADGLSGSGPAQITKEMSLAETLSGEKISFEYNGEKIEIELGDYTDSSTIDDLINDIQDEFDREIGKGRVLVSRESLTGNSAINITTTKPDGSIDGTSTLTVADSVNGLTGPNGIFGFSEGDSNRVNLENSFAKSGLLNAADTTAALTITNDGETLDLEALGLTWESSVEDIIEAINADDKLGITVTYQEMTDKFIVTSKEEGAGGNIELSGAVADALFGTTEGTDFTTKEGKDAVVLVEFESTGERVEISRGTNDINIEGLTINVSGTFGYDETGYIEGTEAVRFSATIDSEDMTERVKTMVEEYNALIASINEAVSTKQNRDYAPLTDDERSQLSEGQIESWEEEASKGLLFGDTDMRALADDLRFIIPPQLREDFEEIGITVSTSYSDNGKLVFDEVKFAAAFEADPTKVQELLATPDTNNEDAPAGLVVEIKEVMDKYAGMTGATKGILVERAGSKYSPVASLQNSLLDEIDIIDDTIENLLRQLEMEEDRYISEFTALEVLISEMNSQSSYLSSMFTTA